MRGPGLGCTSRTRSRGYKVAVLREEMEEMEEMEKRGMEDLRRTERVIISIDCVVGARVSGDCNG